MKAKNLFFDMQELEVSKSLFTTTRLITLKWVTVKDQLLVTMSTTPKHHNNARLVAINETETTHTYKQK